MRPDNNDANGSSRDDLPRDDLTRDDRGPDDRSREARAIDDAALEVELQRYRHHVLPVGFRANFTDRVMAAVAPETHAINSGSTRSSGDGLSRMFRRVAPLAAAAALVLATMNVVQSRTTEQPLLDRVLGLSAVTLAAAYTFDGDLASLGGSAQ